MKSHKISGVIGWDATAGALHEFLSAANGEDVELIISSPGGLVGEALDMFNEVRAYAGKTTAILSGYAMSAASYIPMACNEVKAEDNAVMMIHNAQGVEWGDHNQMMKTAAILKGLSAMLGQAYSKFTGKSKEEIAGLMDAETWLFGDEIVNSGFAHSSITKEEAADEKDIDSATAQARLAFSSMVAKLSSEKTAFYNDLSRAATALGATGAKPNKTHEVNQMDLKELKSKYPDLCAAIAKEATAEMDCPEECKKKAEADAFKKGAEFENKRIQEVLAQKLPGHEALVNGLAFDGKTTGPEAAVAVLQAENKLRATVLTNLQSGAPPVVPPSNGDSLNNLSEDERLKAEWDKDANLRAEFADSFETFAAYKKDIPGVKIKNSKRGGE